MKRSLLSYTLWLLAFGMCVGPAGASDRPAVPDTPAGKLMQSLILSINSKSAREIRTFVATRFEHGSMVKDSWPSQCCNPALVGATLINVARRSGGVTLEEAHGTGAEVVAIVKARHQGTRIYIELQATKRRPAKIQSYQLLPMPHSTGEVLDRAPPGASLGQRLEDARRALQRSTEKDLFSGTVAIVAHGTVLLAAAYGMADKATHRRMTLQTQFDIASVGKLFTSVAVAQLVARGVLSYDTPIIRYLSDYPNRDAASKITLRQLLTHTSGLADIYSGGQPSTPLRRLADYYPLFANRPLLFEPGKGQSYSNTGYLVASMVVERVSGEDFRDYLRTHIFRPAGMTRTTWVRSADVAVPYALGDPDDPLAPDRPWVSAEPFYASLLGGPAIGAGGEYSTVMDLVAFVRALESGRILDHRAFLRMVREGLGCLCSTRDGHLIFGHTGGGPGIDTGVQLDLARDSVFVFLSNYSPPFPQQLAGDLAQLVDSG